MSKKKKKARRAARIPPVTTKDRHHICFQKRNWNSGYAKAICMAFVRYVPVVYHRQLHLNLKGVPVPPAAMLKKAWLDYEKDKEAIDSYDVTRAAAWLYTHIPDPEFRKAIQYQIDFFATQPYK